MSPVRVTNESTGAVIGEKIEVASTFYQRFCGLMFRADPGDGMLLRNVPSIHMFFMKFPIDAVFLDASGRVVKIVENVRPWVGTARAAARDVIELPAGKASQAGCKVGHTLKIG